MFNIHKKTKCFWLRGERISLFVWPRHGQARGQVMILALFFFMAAGTAIVFGLAPSVMSSYKSAQLFLDSRRSYALAEGLAEDLAYRYRTGLAMDSVESITLSGFTAYATSTIVAQVLEIESAGSANLSQKKVKVSLATGTGASFFYGMQTDKGGITLTNSASVSGNVFSNGPIIGANSSVITGDIVSAGPTGSVDGVHASGSVYSHNISSSVIDGDAHYVNISGSTVSGVSYGGSLDQATSTMPIPDSELENWESEAEAGGVATCSGGRYRPSNGETIGPIKIPCNLEINGVNPLYIAGAVWVVGNIEFSNTTNVRIDSGLSGRSVPMIADNPANRSSSSRVTVANSTSFYGAGANSFVVLISRNNSVSTGGSTKAITVSNSVTGDVLVYAPYGEISISNSVHLKEATGYKISVHNSAQVIYETGIANLLFSAGPGGGYTFNSWKEI